MMEKAESREADSMGWTCPVCSASNERANLLCNNCGFVRTLLLQPGGRMKRPQAFCLPRTFFH